VTDQTKDHQHVPGEVIGRAGKFFSEENSYMKSTTWYTIVQYKCKECGEEFLRKVVEG
jgi:hypothetical protein